MKKFLSILIFFLCIVAHGQITPVVDGVRYIPLTTVQILAIVSPSQGETQYSSDTKTKFEFNGTIWVDTGIAAAGDVTAAANLGDNFLIRGDGATKGVQNSGISISDLDDITGANEINIKTLPIFQRFVSLLTTGVEQGGFLSPNTDTTKFDISDGNGIVIDQFTDPDNPTYTEVSWSGLTAIVPTFIATQDISHIGINSAGTVVQQIAGFTEEQHRSIIVLGRLVHADNVNVSSATDLSHVINLYLSEDLVSAIGNINAFGNNFNAASTNLTIRKEAGKSFSPSDNRVTNPLDPNNKTSGVLNPATFIYVHNDGSGGATSNPGETNIDPGFFDDGSGTLQTVGNNQWTNKLIYFFPSSGNVIVRYGEELFNSLISAENAVSKITPADVEGLTNEFVRTVLTVKGNETDLSSANTAFANTGKFGLDGGVIGGGGGAIQDLQDTYNNSVTPEIVTDATRGAVSFKRGTTLDTDDVFEVLNGADAQAFGVKGNGNIFTLGTVDGVDIANDAITSIGAGRTNVIDISHIYGQLQADFDTDGAPPADEFVVITDAIDEMKFIVPLGAVGVDLTVATSVTHIPVLDAITITRIEVDLLVAATGATATFDINLDDGTPASILSTKLTLDTGERFSSTAATPPVISDATIPADSFLTFDVDVIGSTIAGSDGTITIYYTID